MEDVKQVALITNGAIHPDSIANYTKKGYIMLSTMKADMFHPYAMPTDMITFFAKPIDKTVYDEERRKWNESQMPTGNVTGEMHQTKDKGDRL